MSQVWKLHERGELVTIVDSSLNGDVDAQEATNYLRVGLLCTQDMPKLRPSMPNVVKMLTGEIDVSEGKISRPGLLSEFKVKVDLGKVDTEDSSCMVSAGTSGKMDNTSSSSGDRNFSYASMTFNSIYDRN